MKQIPAAFSLVLIYLKKYPTFWIYFFIKLMYVVGDVAVPIIIGHIFSLIFSQAIDSVINPWVFVLLSILLINPVLDRLAFVKGWNISYRAAHDFRIDMVKRLEHTGLSFWQENDKGGILKIIDNAFEHFIYITGEIIHSYLPYIGKLIGIFITTTFIDPVIGLLLLLDCALLALNIRFMVPKESHANLMENKAQENVAARINEYLVNYKTILYLHLFKKQNKEVTAFNDAAYNAYIKRENISGRKWYINNQSHSIIIVLIITYSIFQVLQGKLLIGLLTTIIFFSLKVADLMTGLVWLISELTKYSNSLKRYTDTFKDVPHFTINKASKNIFFQRLVFKNVSLQQENRETLRNVNFTIQKGQKVAIVGITGSGKTTLVDLLLKANTKYSGMILLNDYEYRALDIGEISQMYSIVPQEVQLFKDSLINNITIDIDYDTQLIASMIKVAGLEQLIAKLPAGLENSIHEGAINISGGERQRIGIARALLQQRQIILFDEATASLDPKTEREIISNIVQEFPEQTLIYITHKYSLLNLFDNINVMNDGTIVESGSFDELMKKGGLFKDLFDASQIQ